MVSSAKCPQSEISSFLTLGLLVHTVVSTWFLQHCIEWKFINYSDVITSRMCAEKCG
jgi:hypothetical protein